VIEDALPSIGDAWRSIFIHAAASGDFSASSNASDSADDLRSLALHAFGTGYEALLLTGAGMTAVADFATWALVRASETQPIAKSRTARDPVPVQTDPIISIE
jgi:hypothetical protein